MNPYLQAVRNFHTVVSSDQDQPTRDISPAVLQNRLTLLREELKEVQEAMEHEPIENIAKELADLLYVTFGTIEAYGLSHHFDAIFDAVHMSNMSKLRGGAQFRADGKVVKSSSYKKPDIKAILEKKI